MQKATCGKYQGGKWGHLVHFLSKSKHMQKQNCNNPLQSTWLLFINSVLCPLEIIKVPFAQKKLERSVTVNISLSLKTLRNLLAEGEVQVSRCSKPHSLSCRTEGYFLTEASVTSAKGPEEFPCRPLFVRIYSSIICWGCAGLLCAPLT